MHPAKIPQIQFGKIICSASHFFHNLLRLGFERLHKDKWNGIPVFVGNGDAAVALFPASEEIGSTSSDRAAVRTLHFAFRTDRENFSRAQDELKKRNIPFEFEDHEISHSIYFRDPDGHKIEITTYEL